jgi:hypothetical protein
LTKQAAVVMADPNESYGVSNASDYTGERLAYLTNFVLGILILSFGFLAVIGNGFILVVIGRYKTLRSNLCNLLIGILAISDFLSGEKRFFSLHYPHDISIMIKISNECTSKTYNNFPVINFQPPIQLKKDTVLRIHTKQLRPFLDACGGQRKPDTW